MRFREQNIRALEENACTAGYENMRCNVRLWVYNDKQTESTVISKLSTTIMSIGCPLAKILTMRANTV